MGKPTGFKEFDRQDRSYKPVEDRIKHWLGVGATPTDRVLRFLDGAGIAKRDARNNPQNPRNERLTVRQRLAAYGPHGRIPAVRQLGALPEAHR